MNGFNFYANESRKTQIKQLISTMFTMQSAYYFTHIAPLQRTNRLFCHFWIFHCTQKKWMFLTTTQLPQNNGC